MDVLTPGSKEWIKRDDKARVKARAGVSIAALRHRRNGPLVDCHGKDLYWSKYFANAGVSDRTLEKWVDKRQTTYINPNESYRSQYDQINWNS